MATFLLLVLIGVPLVVVGLAQYWARTPYGRLKPIFALFFRVAPLLNRESAETALVRPMETPEQRAEARARFLRDTAPLSKPLTFAGRIQDRVLDGPGGPLPVRIYTPPGTGPFPLMVYMHGGGFIVGSPDYTDVCTRAIALEAPAIVVSVDYRLAPEAPWPAAVLDSEFVLEWCVEHVLELGARPGKVAVGGDSAGGNLSAVLAQRDRDSGAHRIGLQVLIYPTVDATRLDRESQRAFAQGYGLTTKDIEGCLGLYLQGKVDAGDPGVSPLRASSLEGLPPALVFTAGFDVLRDEGTEYAELLAKAGVEVEHIREPEMPHGYISMTRVCREARENLSQIAAAVRAMPA